MAKKEIIVNDNGSIIFKGYEGSDLVLVKSIVESITKSNAQPLLLTPEQLHGFGSFEDDEGVEDAESNEPKAKLGF